MSTIGDIAPVHYVPTPAEFRASVAGLGDGTYRLDYMGRPKRVELESGYWVAYAEIAADEVPSGTEFGVWTDETERAWLDHTMHVQDRDLALYLGRAYDQIAIWDCANQREIACR